MGIPARTALVVAAAAVLAFAGAEEVQAATPPTISEVYSVTPSRDPAGPTVPTIVTVIGKGLTKFKTFTLLDSFGTPTNAPVFVLVRSKKMIVLRMPTGLAEGRYIVEGGYGVAETLQFSAFLYDSSSEGLINDPNNPLHWSKLQGVPESIADGVDDNSWTEFNGNIYRAPGSVGIGISSPAAKLHVTGNGGVLFEGPIGEGLVPFSGASVPQMIWAPGKYAFRAGFSNDGSWNHDNVGEGSAAFGNNTKASGFVSFATGSGTSASGIVSTALGSATSATGVASTALGGFTDADGNYSIAMGYQATTTADSFASTALGSYTTASGYQAVSMGNYTTAQATDSLVLGRYNLVAGSPDQWVSTDPVLVVGNGNSVTASNAFTLLKNGNLTIAGTLTESSDERLKKDVAPLTGVLRRVAGIRGVTYRLEDASRGPSGPQIGLLAQEVREVFPELVQEDAQGTLSVAYGKFSAVLLEAVKEQQAALEERDRRIQSLEERLARLEAKAGE